MEIVTDDLKSTPVSGGSPLSSLRETDPSSAQAIQDLRLAGVLMQDEWFGLRILYEVQEAERGVSATELADRTARPVDSVVASLSLLVRHGVVDVAGDRFLCTTEGNAVLERVDAITGEPEVEVREAVR